MSTKHYDALLVGAGLYNATLANRLVSNGKSVLVIDRRDNVGGNCHTEMQDGILVHKYGAHIFHTDSLTVWDFVNRFAHFHPYVNSPIAIAGDGRAYNLPFNMNTFAQLFHVNTPEEAARAIAQEIDTAVLVGDVTPSNLEEQAISMVGRTIYETLIRDYTEKQWGRPCTELDPSVIKRIPVRMTYDNNYFSDWRQGIPDEGYTSMISNMLTGAEVLLGVDYLSDKASWNDKADRVYYSGCLDEYFGYACGMLDYRSLEFKEETYYNTNNKQGTAVFNYTSHNQEYTRSIEHRFFMSYCSAENHTIVSYEYPRLWRPGLEPYYPVNNEASAELYSIYRGMLPGKVVPTGRLGLYKYMDMDDTVAAALALPIE